MHQIRIRARVATSWLSAAAVVALSVVSHAAGQTAANAWPLDHAHSRVTFSVTKWGFAEVEGRFKDFAGTLVYDAAAPERSRLDWRVAVASVDTGEAARDHSLQAPEYFDAARFPTLTFTTTKVRVAADRQLDVSGTLTIRGASRPVTVRAIDRGRHAVPGEGEYQLFETTFTLDRYDYGVRGGSLLGPAISREVTIHLIAAAKAPGR
jgi:polyisoprenoid-binding protein YceI